MSPSSLTHATTYHLVALTSKTEGVLPVPNTKIKWDRGNPTGHGIIFIGDGDEIFCYVPPGGG